jgi:hypothetical protein
MRGVLGAGLTVAALLVVAAPARATFPGANGVIAYELRAFQDDPDGPGDFVAPDLWTIRAGGGGARALTVDGATGQPAWSPDGRQIVLGGGPALERFRLAGGASIALTVAPAASKAWGFLPAWQPRP